MTVDLFSNFHFQVPISYKILKSGNSFRLITLSLTNNFNLVFFNYGLPFSM